MPVAYRGLDMDTNDKPKTSNGGRCDGCQRNVAWGEYVLETRYRLRGTERVAYVWRGHKQGTGCRKPTKD